MAYFTSETYKSLIYEEDSKHSLTININDNIVNNNYIRNLSLKENIFETDYFVLGSAAISEVSLELDNDALIEIDDFNEISIDYNLFLTETTKETIPLGKYVVKKIDNNSELYTKYTLYDYMDKFNVEVDFSSIVPCTRYEVLQYICEKCGVPLKNESIVNGDVLVNVYDNSISARTYLSLLSERSGGFASITRDGELEIKSFNELDTINLPVNKIGEYKINNQKTISRLIYENATQKFEAGDESGETVYLNSDSPFSCTQEEVNNIFNIIEGLTFQSLELRIWGDPSIDRGDILKVKNIISFAQKEWTFGNGFYGKYKTTLNDTDKKSNVSKITSIQKIKKLQSKLDELKGEIILAVEEINSNANKNEAYKEYLEKMVINLENGVTNTFSEAGGNNIFRNTGLWFKDEGENTFEYWIGTANKKLNYEAVSKNSILLKNGTFSQSQEVPNGNYSVSFNYKKLIEVAIATVTINEHTYSLDSLVLKQFYTGEQNDNKQYIVQPLAVTSGHITITFSSDTENSIEIYDLMVNKGDVKLAYSQNENETTTDTVNISKGITITSSSTDVKFKADSDGIRTVNIVSGEERTKFTDDGMETKKAVVTDEANLCNILIDEVGDQTWLTRL